LDIIGTWYYLILHGGGGTTRPFQGIETRRTSENTQQSGHAPGSEPEKCQRWRTGVAQMRDNPEGGELGTADNVHTPQALQEEFFRFILLR